MLPPFRRCGRNSKRFSKVEEKLEKPLFAGVLQFFFWASFSAVNPPQPSISFRQTNNFRFFFSDGAETFFRVLQEWIR
jgi:hypothetical protein